MPPRKKLLLRIQPRLWEELERWAAQEFRSINGQIEFLLQRAVSEHLSGSSPKKRGPDTKGPRRE
jgi:hypothetical protein